MAAEAGIRTRSYPSGGWISPLGMIRSAFGELGVEIDDGLIVILWDAEFPNWDMN